MVDYNPAYNFILAISSDVGANYNSSDATIVSITPSASELTWVKSSDYNYEMNDIVYNTFVGNCTMGQEPGRTVGYVQKRMINWSGADKASICLSSDVAKLYYLW